jgi:hypothetical protein
LEVITRRLLHWRAVDIALEFLELQCLADQEHVPVVDVGSRSGALFAVFSGQRRNILILARLLAADGASKSAEPLAHATRGLGLKSWRWV